MIDKAGMLERRNKNFAVEINKDRFPVDSEDEFILSITHNGYQWQGVRLLPNEAREVIELLNKYLETIE